MQNLRNLSLPTFSGIEKLNESIDFLNELKEDER